LQTKLFDAGEKSSMLPFVEKLPLVDLRDEFVSTSGQVHQAALGWASAARRLNRARPANMACSAIT
jgi:hypothetical protein